MSKGLLIQLFLVNECRHCRHDLGVRLTGGQNQHIHISWKKHTVLVAVWVGITHMGR